MAFSGKLLSLRVARTAKVENFSLRISSQAAARIGASASPVAAALASV